MIKERLSNLADRAVEAAQDPEIQARVRSAARAMGETALGSALGEDGLDIVKTDRHGNRKVKKVKAVRVAARALRNPIGVAQKAARGVASEARHTATNSGIEAARSAIASRRSGEPVQEDPFDVFSIPTTSESAPRDFRSEIFGDSVWDQLDQAETTIAEPSRRERIAGRIARLHPSRGAEQESPLPIPHVEEDEFGLPSLPSPTSIPYSREDLMSDDFWAVPDQAEPQKQGRIAGIRDRLHRDHDNLPPSPL